ncbi:MAG TPA: ABC transporter permease [Acidimicrobiales bacterium]
MSTVTTRLPVEAAPAPAGFRRWLGTTMRIAQLELRLFLREPAVAVGLVAFPAVTVLILAGVFGSTPESEFAGVAPSQHYVVGYIGVVLAHMGLVVLPVHVASSRELGVVRRYRAAGVSSVSLLASHAVVGAVLGVAASAIVLVVGASVYDVAAPDSSLGVAAWVAAGVVCFVALGIALGTLMPSSRAANAVGNLLFVPMFLLGGGGPPREVMTGPMQALSDVLPLTHIIGGLRESWLGATDDPQALWWTVLVTAVAVGLAVRSARRRAD